VCARPRRTVVLAQALVHHPDRFVMAIILGCILGYFAYEKALVYYARAATYDLKKLDDLNVTSTFYDVNNEELAAFLSRTASSSSPRRFRRPCARRSCGGRSPVLRAWRDRLLGYLRPSGNLSKKSHGVQAAARSSSNWPSISSAIFPHDGPQISRAFVAIRLEQNLTKDQIMNYYLNRIYFGKGYFGVGAAARGYFGKEAKDLSVPECALLAGIIRAPTSSRLASIRKRPSGAAMPR